MVVRKAISGVLVLCALVSFGCSDFDDVSIVVDLRHLGAVASPPEVVSPVDPDNPTDLALVPVEVCALVADPQTTRRLEYRITACPPADDRRCDPNDPTAVIATGDVDDPESAVVPVSLCGTLAVDANLLAILEASLSEDPLSGFGGVAVQAEIAVWPEGQPDDAEYASKRVVYAAQIPEERVANLNPTLTEFQYRIDGGELMTLPEGRCQDIAGVAMVAGESIEIDPIEPDGAREDYVLPTFDGDVRRFTESLTYAWFATTGLWDREQTGGPRDFAGNEPPLDSTWSASFSPEQLSELPDDGLLRVSIWVVQRDERGGAAWYESCLDVSLP